MLVSPEEFVRYFARARERTARLIPLIPAEAIEWRIADHSFSFGDILRHLAGTERWMWAESVAGRPSRYPGHDASLAPGYEATRAYFDSLHQDAMEIFQRLTPEAFTRPVQTPAGVTLPAWKWLRAMVEHEAHHRGQLYLMLRTIGIPTPPLFGLTSEDVMARSAHDGRRSV